MGMAGNQQGKGSFGPIPVLIAVCRSLGGGGAFSEPFGMASRFLPARNPPNLRIHLLSTTFYLQHFI